MTEVVRRWAPWQKVIDLDVLQKRWVWILEPPHETAESQPNSLDLLASVMAANGGKMLK